MEAGARLTKSSTSARVRGRPPSGEAAQSPESSREGLTSLRFERGRRQVFHSENSSVSGGDEVELGTRGLPARRATWLVPVGTEVKYILALRRGWYDSELLGIETRCGQGSYLPSEGSPRG